MGGSPNGTAPRTGRRTFLKALGGAAGLAALPIPAPRAAAAEAPPGEPADRPVSGDPDVIVIGGGFAGVTAARELQHRGLRTLLLEARQRLGGRTFTARVGDAHFDLGGTWIHWTQPHVWAEAMRYGLPLVETPGAVPERVSWWTGAKVKQAGVGEALALASAAICGEGEAPDLPLRALEALALIEDLMIRFHEPAVRVFPRPFDPFHTDAWQAFDGMSVKDRLDEMKLSPTRRALLEGVLGSACCGSFAASGYVEMLRWWALSGATFQRYGDSVGRFTLRDGTVSLLEAILADGAPAVRLGTPVARVEQGGGEVRVISVQGERFRARAVIVALPMNVLASVEFTPALDSAKLSASQERHAGAGVKLYARVRGEVPNFVGFAPESEPLSMLFTAETGTEGGVLIGFGTSPQQLDTHNKPAVQAAVERFLPGVEVVDSFAYDWHLDPYSLGTWCVLRPEQMTKFLAKLREPEGLVHFAGGDIALGWRGFIDGAIESGSRVAHEVALRLGGRAARRAGATAAGVGATRAQDDPIATTASASPAEDATLRPCAVCHPTDASGAHGVGPNLHGVAGRELASAPGYRYSEALRARGGRWSPAELDAFLADPAKHVPGTAMPFGGVKEPAARAALIEALRTLR